MRAKGVQIRWELLLVVLIGVLAAMLRLGRLDWPPLTEAEASQALGAAFRTPGASPQWTPAEGWAPLAPAYAAFTRIVFEVASPDDARARLFPALAGIGLVLSPLWMRPRLGRGPALAASLLLAISPSLVTVARTADGESLALFGAATALALVWGESEERLSSRRLLGAAAMGGLALASGPTVFTALLGLGLAALLLARMTRQDQTRMCLIPREELLRTLGIALGVMLLVASGLGTAVHDVAGISESFGAWIAGWGHSGETGPLTALLAFILYEPLVILFGLVGTASSRRASSTLGRACAAWAAGGFLVLLIYPSRHPADMAWIVLPLAVLGGQGLAEMADRAVRGWSWQVHGTLVPVLLLLAGIGYVQLANYAAGRGPGMYAPDPAMSLGLAVAVVVLAIVIVILYAAGWSQGAALGSAGTAAAVVLFLVNLSTIARLNLAATAAGAKDLWRAEATAPGVHLVLDTLEGVSQTHTGRIDALPVTTAGDPSALMAWVLRQFPRAVPATAGEAPEAVIAPEGVVPEGLAAEYLGQTLTVAERRAWAGILPPEPVTWWVLRQAPTEPIRWLLLVRRDLATFGEEGVSAP